ncbi:hypothetical protein DXG01_012577, partial [Tephrocybe rancida]
MSRLRNFQPSHLRQPHTNRPDSPGEEFSEPSDSAAESESDNPDDLVPQDTDSPDPWGSWDADDLRAQSLKGKRNPRATKSPRRHPILDHTRLDTPKAIEEKLRAFKNSFRQTEHNLATLRITHKETLRVNEELKHRLEELEAQIRELKATAAEAVDPEHLDKLDGAQLAALFCRMGKQFTALQEPFKTFFEDPTLFSRACPASSALNPDIRFVSAISRAKGFLAAVYEFIDERYHCYISGTIFRQE